MKKFSVKTKVLAIICFLWMAFIYVLSAQSSSDSTFISEKMTGIAVDIMDGEDKKTTAEEAGFGGTNKGIIDDIENGLVPAKDFFGINRFEFKIVMRKMAHLFLFFMLAVLVNVTAISHVKKNSLKIAVLSFGLSAFYGIIDEFHQLFVEGRGCNFKDMAIDALGCAAGVITVCVLYALVMLIKHIKTKSAAL